MDKEKIVEQIRDLELVLRYYPESYTDTVMCNPYQVVLRRVSDKMFCWAEAYRKPETAMNVFSIAEGILASVYQHLEQNVVRRIENE